MNPATHSVSHRPPTFSLQHRGLLPHAGPFSRAFRTFRRPLRVVPRAAAFSITPRPSRLSAPTPASLTHTIALHLRARYLSSCGVILVHLHLNNSNSMTTPFTKHRPLPQVCAPALLCLGPTSPSRSTLPLAPVVSVPLPAHTGHYPPALLRPNTNAWGNGENEWVFFGACTVRFCLNILEFFP
jgi:hypothetical protein